MYASIPTRICLPALQIPTTLITRSVPRQVPSRLILHRQTAPDSQIIQLTKVTDIIAELLVGKLDGAYIETAVAESYAKNYPDLCVVLDVPYEGAEGSAIGVCKGNDALKAAVNEAIAKAKKEGKMDEFVAKANEQASGEIIEGLLDQ